MRHFKHSTQKKIHLGDHFAMDDGTTAVVVKKHRHDHYTVVPFDGDEPAGRPYDVTGDIIRAQEEGFRGQLLHRNPAKRKWIAEALGVRRRYRGLGAHHRKAYRVEGAHKGALRRKAHARKGEPIPPETLERLAHSRNPVTRHQAVMARTLARLRARRSR